MKVTFYGGAEEVGRSCILVTTEQTKILLDAGVKLGEKEEHPMIPDSLLKQIDGIFISHAHLDHIGYLPHLFSHGYRGNVYATKPTIELTNVLISDYMRISEPKDVTKEGLAMLQKSFKIVEFREKIKFKDLTITFIPAGHIVGSSMLLVEDGKKRFIYTGDANLKKTRLLEGADTRNLSAETLIMESTYGGRKDVFPNEEIVAKQALASINETLKQGGKIMIPSFAVGRAQEVLLMLDDYMNSGLLTKVPIYVDGMIKKAMRIYRHNVIYCRKELQRRILMSDYDPFRSENFIFIEKKQERSKPLKPDHACIIVTTSGMLTGGPILSYLSRLGGNPANKMIIVGYQAEGTPGRRLQDGAKEIEIDGRKVAIRIKIETYHLSAHADRKQLDMLVSKISDLKNIFILHGELSKSGELRDDLVAKKYNAVIPHIGNEYQI